MKKNVVKSVLLSFLIIASIYQVITLWFDNVSDRNFFYSVINRFTNFISEPQEEDKAYMINPRIMGVYLGASDKDFTIIERGGDDYRNILNESTKMILKVVSAGEFEGIYDKADFIWEKRGLIFSLSMPMSKEILASDLNVNSGKFEGIVNVSSLGIIPATDTDSKVKAYFISENANQIYVFSLPVSELKDENDAVRKFIEKTTAKGYPAYISTLKNEIELFNGNVLLPLPSDTIYYFNPLALNIPFIEDGTIKSDALEEYINIFFDNPNVKWTIQNNDIMIYGDDNALIKYNENGLLEYSGLENSNNVTQTVSAAFNTAEEFLKRDYLLSNLDYYLVNFEDKDGKKTFYYAYGYDHLPIHLEESLLSKNTLTYPIEITVQKGKVVKYRRLVIEIDNNGSQELFKGQFERALNQFVDEQKISGGQLEDMYLGYVNQGEQIKLMWIIKSQGKYYWIEFN